MLHCKLGLDLQLFTHLVGEKFTERAFNIIVALLCEQWIRSILCNGMWRPQTAMFDYLIENADDLVMPAYKSTLA